MTSNERQFKCDVCSSTFARKDHLKNHIIGVHLKLKDCVCHICDATFALMASLKVHVKAVHEKIKDFDFN